MPYAKLMESYRAAQSAKFDEKVAKANASMAPRYLCGSTETVMKEFTELKTTGVGGVFVRFRVGPMPAEFSSRALQLFMKDIAPAMRERTLATV
jgi:hypothetical protein